MLMFLKKNITKPIVIVLVLVLVFGIFIYTFYNTIMALGPTTIYCDSDFETLVNYIVNAVGNVNPEDLRVTLSNLELHQDQVGIPTNGYDIDINNPGYFFEMFFLSQDLAVEQVDGVVVNVIKVNNIIYTVHPDLILFLLNMFLSVEFF